MARKMIDKVRLTGYGRSAEEAEKDLAAAIVEFLKPCAPDRAMSLSEFCENVWIPSQQNLAPLTQKKYLQNYRQYIKGPLGQGALKDVTVSAVQLWLNLLSKQSEGTRKFAFDTLRTILTHAWRMELIDSNPCSRIKFTVRKTKRDRMLEIEKVREILAAVAGTPMSCPVFMATILGMSRGEICAASWDNLSRTRFGLRVDEQIITVKEEGKPQQHLPTRTKAANRTRVIPLTPWMIEEIDSRGDLDNRLICTFERREWVPNTMTNHWQAMRDDLGLPDWHFHDLRHLFAGLLDESGSNLLTASGLLGHSEPNMTLVYTSQMERRSREAMNNLGAFITGGRASTDTTSDTN